MNRHLLTARTTTISLVVFALLSGITGLPLPTLAVLAAPPLYRQPSNVATRTPYTQSPLHFEVNQGQADGQIKFMAQADGYRLFLTATEAIFALPKVTPLTGDAKSSHAFKDSTPIHTSKSERALLRMELVGANATPQVVGLEELPGKANYFLGNAPTRWRTNIPTYQKVRYAGVYPGIDLLYYGNQRQVEYDFVVAPSADPTRIVLGFAGVDQLELNPAGDLLLHVGAAHLRMNKPIIYQEVAGVRQPIAGGFALNSKKQITFQIGAYDISHPLIIDPVLTFAGYVGGVGQDFGNGIAIDPNGNIYIVGYTDSDQATLPVTSGPDLSYNGNQDVFVTKLTADGTQVVYSGYIGGSGQEFGMNIAVDGGGNAYIIGYTNSSEATFPVTVGPDLSYNGGLDTFVAKLSPNGAMLQYAGYIGGAGNDFGNGIAVDGSGNIYVVGTTTSTEATFPVTVGPDLTFSGPGEGYVAKVNATGAGLLYAGYIGGSGDEAINAVALEPTCVAACQAYVAGSSASDQTTFPVIGGPDLTYNGGTDAFVAKVRDDGAALVYSGYIGGSGADYLYSIAVDNGGNAYVYGNTDSNEATFPVTVGPGLTYQGGRYDAFIAKLNASGTALTYAGYIGGAGDEFGRGIAVDDAGNAYVSGWTNSTEATFPVLGGPDLSYNGGPSDVFVAKVNMAGTALDYAGYAGGNGEEITGHANPITVDRAGNASYLIGATTSNEATFPVKIGPDLTFNGATDSFIAKVSNTPVLCVPPSLVVIITFPPPNGQENWFTTDPVQGAVTANAFVNVTAITCTGATVSNLTGLNTLQMNGTLTVVGDGIHNVSCTAIDSVGNQCAGATTIVRIDTTAPTLAPVVTPNPVLLGGAVTVSVGATDALSGVSVQSCGVVDASTVGSKTVICTATDRAGNRASVNVNYAVIYNFSGFFPPVDNLHVLNVMNAGSSTPVKFSLSGNQGLAILASGYPASQPITCDTSAPLDDIEETVAAGGSALTYDAVSGQYTYVWKTDKAWAGACRQLIVRLNDGTEQRANFKFK